MAPSPQTTGLSFEAAKSEARFFGIMSAVLASVAAMVPASVIKAFALVGFASTGWMFLFHGSTAISMTLDSHHRRWFQLAVSIAVPTLLSVYFVKDTATVTLQGVVSHMLSAWYLIPVVLIAYVSWFAADQLNKEHPFRGFLIACAIIFVMCFMGHNGIYTEYDDYTESSATYIDKAQAERAVQTGRYFGQFLVYVTVSYITMLVKMRKVRHLTTG